MKDLFKRVILEHGIDNWDDLRNPVQFEEWVESVAQAIHREIVRQTAQAFRDKEELKATTRKPWDS